MSMRIFGLGAVLVGLGLAAFSGGCGGGNEGGGGSGAATTTTTTTTHQTTTTGNTGGSGGSAGIHTIDGAADIAIDGTTSGTLVDTDTSDFYKFTGKAGDRLVLAAYATNLPQGGDPSYADLTLALIGPDKNLSAPLTYTDDAFPSGGSTDPAIYVQLPADGDYYLAVQDCHTLFSSGCPAPADGVTSFDYDVYVVKTASLTTPELVAAATQDGTTAKADQVAYTASSQAGLYTSVLMGGAFKSATDTQVFAFKPPTDVTVDAGARQRAIFFVQPIGNAYGDLSKANAKVWVTDSTGTNILASADQNKYLIDQDNFARLEFSLPVTLDQQYYLFVQNTHTGGTNLTDFYFIDHWLNYYLNVAEKEGATAKGTNDTSATAEAMAVVGTSGTLFNVDGDIFEPGATGDVDWYKITVPSAVTKTQTWCDVSRAGSGLRNFTLEVFGADATTSLGKTVDSLDKDFATAVITVPTGATTLYLKATADTQDAVVKGTYYNCFTAFE